MNETTHLPSSNSNSHGMMVRRFDLPGNHDGEWGVPATMTAALPGPVPTSAYFHAFRRRWWAALFLGLLISGIAAGIAWFSQKPKFTAVALLRIATSDKPIFQGNQGVSYVPNAYDVYRGTQLQMLKSRFVLIRALGNPNAVNLEMVKEQPDAVSWLEEALQTQAPRDTEVIRVALKGDDAKETVTLLQSVVDAYLKEVEDIEQGEQRVRLNAILKAASDKDSILRQKRLEFRNLTQRVGTLDAHVLAVKQTDLVQNLGEVRRQHMNVQSDLGKTQGEIKALQAMMENAKNGQDSTLFEADLASALMRDTQYVTLSQNYSALTSSAAATQSFTQPVLQARYTKNDVELQKALKQQIDTRRKEVLEEMKGAGLAKAQFDLKRLEMQANNLVEQEKQLKQKLDVLNDEANKIGIFSVDVEAMKDEIKQLEEVLGGLYTKKEQLEVEIKDASRVKKLQDADVPDSPDQVRRLALTGFALLAGFSLPFVGIIWWDTRGQRVNSSYQVIAGTGLDVIGAVPVIPPRVARQLSSPNKQQYYYWRALVTESVDSISARLLHIEEREHTRVILVSSAVGGEGKTTMATQLAMSLARMGHRTALVDFDLRRPAVDRIFNLPLQPGISELLTGKAEFSEILQATTNENLFVVTAGQWDRSVHAALAGGAAGPLFEELRKECKFIVVDGCPVLPLADTRFVSRYVDAVVLSVLRDVSRVPQIRTACDILSAFGVRVLGAVVAESAGDVYCKDPRYQPKAPA